jgi:hypothetical protein
MMLTTGKRQTKSVLINRPLYPLSIPHTSASFIATEQHLHYDCMLCLGLTRNRSTRPLEDFAYAYKRAPQKPYGKTPPCHAKPFVLAIVPFDGDARHHQSRTAACQHPDCRHRMITFYITLPLA